MNKFFLILIFFVTIHADAQADSLCLDSKRVARVFSTYNWYDEGLETERAGANWHCNPKTLPYKVFKALIMMEDLPLMDMKKDILNRNAFGKSATEYLRARVNNFVFKGVEEGCDANTMAYVSGDTAGTVYLCKLLAENSTSMTMSVLIHEARHLDNNGYSHDICEHGAYIGNLACDSSYEMRGAYGMGTEFSVRLARTEGVAEAIRTEARANAVTSLLNRFNQSPLKIKTKGQN